MPIIYTNKFKSMILLKENYNSIKAKKNIYINMATKT